MLSIFSYVYWPCVYLLWRDIDSDLMTMLNFKVFFFIYSRYKSLVRYMICIHFLPFCGLSSFLVLFVAQKFFKHLSNVTYGSLYFSI